MTGPRKEETPVILVVEDDESVRHSVIDLLQAHGYAATGAVDGQHGLDLLRAGLRPCLILLDVRMPRKDGLEFRAEQEKYAELSDIPTVIVSATDVRQQLSSLVRVLPKPMPVDELLAIAAQHCSGDD